MDLFRPGEKETERRMKTDKREKDKKRETGKVRKKVQKWVQSKKEGLRGGDRKKGPVREKVGDGKRAIRKRGGTERGMKRQSERDRDRDTEIDI